MEITRKLQQTGFVILSFIVLLSLASCKNHGNSNGVPEEFNSWSTPEKMKFLMENMAPDSVGRFICNAAMGKVYNARIELQQAQLYAYEHYNEDDLVGFAEACKEYEESLPLHEKVKFVKISATENPDIYSYELGLGYVSSIREEKKDVALVKDELEALKRECKYDPDFYKRFMKGFKTALNLDRDRDLDKNIYDTFINYPDSIK